MSSTKWQTECLMVSEGLSQILLQMIRFSTVEKALETSRKWWVKCTRDLEILTEHRKDNFKAWSTATQRQLAKTGGQSKRFSSRTQKEQSVQTARRSLSANRCMKTREPVSKKWRTSGCLMVRGEKLWNSALEMNGAKKIYTEILPRTKHTILTRPGIGWLKELDSGNKVIDLVTRNMQ